ncbi:MAG: hypothetical protein V2A79_09865 [Planctomycetota bacterium]
MWTQVTKWRSWVMMVGAAVLLLAGCQGGEWSVAAGSNYEVSELAALYSPDPNGGLGLMVMSDSAIPETTAENVAAGLIVQFRIGDLVAGALDRVLPGEWLPPVDAPVEAYGTLALLYEPDGEDFLFLPGTELRFRPGSAIQPYLRTEWLTPENSSALEDDLLTTFGVVYRFR